MWIQICLFFMQSSDHIINQMLCRYHTLYIIVLVPYDIRSQTGKETKDSPQQLVGEEPLLLSRRVPTTEVYASTELILSSCFEYLLTPYQMYNIYKCTKHAIKLKHDTICK